MLSTNAKSKLKPKNFQKIRISSEYHSVPKSDKLRSRSALNKHEKQAKNKNHDDSSVGKIFKVPGTQDIININTSTRIDAQITREFLAKRRAQRFEQPEKKSADNSFFKVSRKTSLSSKNDIKEKHRRFVNRDFIYAKK